MFLLKDLSNEELTDFLSLSLEEASKKISALIEKYYPKIETDSEEFKNLAINYMASFNLEYLIRKYPYIYASYTPLYTRTGLIRELVLNNYAFNKERYIVN